MKMARARIRVEDDNLPGRVEHDTAEREKRREQKEEQKSKKSRERERKVQQPSL